MNGKFEKDVKLKERAFRQLGAGSIKPLGWLER